jgi:plastocyanin
MINTPARIYFTIAFLALVATIGYSIAEDDHAGTVLLLFLMGVALFNGLAAAGSGISDRAPWVAADAPITEVPIGPANISPPSSWPLVGAVAVGVMAVGMAVGAGLVIAGIIVAFIAAGGWLGQSWRESAGWNAAKGRRLDERLVAPFGIPLGAFAVVVLIVGAISRVLLAVNEHVSVAIAISAALLTLLVFALLATRASVSKKVITAVVAIAGIGLVSAGVAGAAKGERKFETKESTVEQLSLVAKNTQYNKTALEATANQNFEIKFSNEDAGVYHNVAIWTEPSGGSPIVNGQPLQGVNKITYTFSVPQPGTYAFRCDFHANMTGTLTIK